MVPNFYHTMAAIGTGRFLRQISVQWLSGCYRVDLLTNVIPQSDRSKLSKRLRDKKKYRRLAYFRAAPPSQRIPNLMFQWITGKFAYLSTWFGFTIGCGMAKRFPLTAFWLADRLAAIAYRCFHGYRKRSLRNIRIAFGDHLAPSAIDSTARRTLRNIFRACVELAGAVDTAEADIKAPITLMGRENLDAALAKGHGVVLLSAHLGKFFPARQSAHRRRLPNRGANELAARSRLGRIAG
ncbi:MAG: hypothetical protein EXR70_10200 [Deltaproteobacteria bacterium]|nr:hypothetical protein [Deltaproteobacteria bacterium]